MSDTTFTWSDLQAKQNNELLKNLGNFVNRALAFIAKPEGRELYSMHYAAYSIQHIPNSVFYAVCNIEGLERARGYSHSA